jgi:flagellar protein FlaG
MLKGLDSILSPICSRAGYAGGLSSPPGIQPAKREPPKQNCEDLGAAAQKSLKFHLHEDTGQIFVQVIAKEDGRVIREIPSEELLDLETRIDEMTGVLFSKDV